MLCRLFSRAYVTTCNLKIGQEVPKASKKLEKFFKGLGVGNLNYILDLFGRLAYSD